MAAVIFLMILLLVDYGAAESTREKLSAAVINITKGGLETILRPLTTTLSRTEDTFRGILRSSDPKTDDNIPENSEGRFPFNVLGSAEGGRSLDFLGRIVSSVRPYLVPLRIFSSKSSGNDTTMEWSTSKEE